MAINTKYYSSRPSDQSSTPCFREEEFLSFPSLFLHTKYQSSALSSFREEEFQSFPSLFLCFELATPGAGPVLTPGASYEQSF